MTGKQGPLLTKGAASQVGSIAGAIVAKNGPLFFLTDPAGRVPLQHAHGYGLYYHDCRYLGGYDIRLGRAHPDVLAASGARGWAADFQLTNGDIALGDGARVAKERVGLRWIRVVDGERLALCETLELVNHDAGDVELPLSLSFRARFEDIFVVRGMRPEDPGKVVETRWLGRDLLFFLYHGSDDVFRSLAIRFDPAPARRRRHGAAAWRFRLVPQRPTLLHVTLQLAESKDEQAVRPKEEGGRERAGGHVPRLSAGLQARADEWMKQTATVVSDDDRLNAVVRRSLLDLGTLHTRLDGRSFFAAGVPWYVTLFGRDSIISALQALPFDTAVAADTLRLLARFQGTKRDAWRAEEPGKIPHELRVGELANKGAIPYTPYYGTVDATPLWLILLGRHAAWTGSLDLFHELRPCAEAALAWLDDAGGRDGDGFLAYDAGAAPDGIVNQGWKDSGDAIVNADGSIATPPIALVEVQGYAWRARRELADLLHQDGQAGRADSLRGTADRLRERFQRAFWLADRNIYALALQKDHRPCAVVSSNPAQALWTGIVPREHARAVRDSLMAEEMFSGWGIRTLATKEKRYNPAGYHLGTVWPHDNAFAAAGMKRAGLAQDALRVLDALLAAAACFDHDRLPEVFSGFAPSLFPTPVHYPVACHPQAWAAGSVPFLLTELLGLEPDGFRRRLRVLDPVLPLRVQTLELNGLRVADARVSLRFTRADDRVRVEVTERESEVEVVTD